MLAIQPSPQKWYKGTRDYEDRHKPGTEDCCHTQHSTIKDAPAHQIPILTYLFPSYLFFPWN